MDATTDAAAERYAQEQRARPRADRCFACKRPAWGVVIGLVMCADCGNRAGWYVPAMPLTGLQLTFAACMVAQRLREAINADA